MRSAIHLLAPLIRAIGSLSFGRYIRDPNQGLLALQPRLANVCTRDSRTLYSTNQKSRQSGQSLSHSHMNSNTTRPRMIARIMLVSQRLRDRHSVASGKRVSERVDNGG